MEINTKKSQTIGKYTEDQYKVGNQAWLIYDAPFKAARNIAAAVVGSKVLDIGGGTGVMAGIISLIKEVKVSVYEENIYKIPYPDNHFDTVYTSHVLEHLDNPEGVISEALRVSKKRVIHVVPEGDVQDINLGTPHIQLFNRVRLMDMVLGSYKGSVSNFELRFIPDHHINSLMIIIDK